LGLVGRVAAERVVRAVGQQAAEHDVEQQVARELGRGVEVQVQQDEAAQYGSRDGERPAPGHPDRRTHAEFVF